MRQPLFLCGRLNSHHHVALRSMAGCFQPGFAGAGLGASAKPKALSSSSLRCSSTNSGSRASTVRRRSKLVGGPSSACRRSFPLRRSMGILRSVLMLMVRIRVWVGWGSVVAGDCLGVGSLCRNCISLPKLGTIANQKIACSVGIAGADTSAQRPKRWPAASQSLPNLVTLAHRIDANQPRGCATCPAHPPPLPLGPSHR